MSYWIAGIDVHKKMLAVAVADVEVDGDFHFERQKVGTTPIDLRRLADWLVDHEVDEVVMESIAQYWRPVWDTFNDRRTADLLRRDLERCAGPRDRTRARLAAAARHDSAGPAQAARAVPAEESRETLASHR